MTALAQRLSVPLAATVLSSPFLFSRAAAASATGGGSAGGSFLQLQNFTPYHALAGGLLLGAATALRMILVGDTLGISGIIGGIVKGKHLEVSRWMFLAGLLSGGVALKSLYPAGLGTVESPVWRSVLAGLLVGTGVTLGNGCTSGHGICGNARLSNRSMVYTLVFMASGAVTATLTQSGSAVTFNGGAPMPSTEAAASLSASVMAAFLAVYVGMSGLKSAKLMPENVVIHSLTYIDGCLFAIGLGVSTMTNPVKVAQFLDFSQGSWDPSLMFVMGGALALNIPLMHAIVIPGRLKTPVLTRQFSYPSNKTIDNRLLLGGVLFGAGWGLGGACPGPAIVSLVSPSTGLHYWIAAFMSGIALAHRFL
jgi:uncharacterized membrane protein YedE/YeeE